MKLRKPCQHGKYDEHVDIPEADPPVPIGTIRGPFFPCPGGVFLHDDTLIIEKEDGEWPLWAVHAVWTNSTEQVLDGLLVATFREAE